MRKHLSIIIILLATSFMQACRTMSNDESALKIDSGIFLTKNSVNSAPGVVPLQMEFNGSASACSATVVSDNTVVTAAHCVRGGRQTARRVCITAIGYNNVCTDQVYFPPQYDSNNDGEQAKWVWDFAVLVFPKKTFKNYYRLYQGPIGVEQVGQPVVMVGYSNADLGRNVAVKRWGRNQIQQMEEGVTIITSYGRSADRVAVSPGDSGGPLFIGCQLAGVASRMAAGNDKFSLHTNLSLPATKAFLATIKSKGGYICGLDNDDPEQCGAAGMASFLDSPPPEANGNAGYPCSPSTPAGTTPPASPQGWQLASQDVGINVLDASDTPRLAIAVPQTAKDVGLCVMGAAMSKPEQCIAGAAGWHALTKDPVASPATKTIYNSAPLQGLGTATASVIVVFQDVSVSPSGTATASKYTTIELKKR